MTGNVVGHLLAEYGQGLLRLRGTGPTMCKGSEDAARAGARGKFRHLRTVRAANGRCA
jgi:hypothetical protein